MPLGDYRFFGKLPGGVATVYNVTLTNVNTEYSQALLAGCMYFEFQEQTTPGAATHDIRYAFVTGKVAAPTSPWMTVKAGNAYNSPQINGGNAITLYLAAPTGAAGIIVEITAWT